MFDINQIRPILQILSETEAVLVGGQAVNLWSEYFREIRAARCAGPHLLALKILLNCGRRRHERLS
jgi:hypothetical protein